MMINIDYIHTLVDIQSVVYSQEPPRIVVVVGI